MRWVTKRFEELSGREMYDVMALRQRVFVVEQKCPFLDADGRDPRGLHILGYESEPLVAYARIFPAGVVGPAHAASFGRVVSAPEVRRTGIGKQIVARAMAEIDARWGRPAIWIAAQEHLRRFYAEFGFQPTGDPYFDDDILHLDMIRGGGAAFVGETLVGETFLGETVEDAPAHDAPMR